ncbi:MAG: SRPBCC family protein [Minicystis sp.]
MTTMQVTTTVHAVPERARRKAGINIGDAERVLSAIGGGVLALWGLGRRSLPGIALTAAGGLLLRRGLTGRSALYRTLGVSTAAARAGKRGPPALPSLGEGAIRLERTITIDYGRADLFHVLRDPTNLPRWFAPVTRVDPIHDGDRARWYARGPGGAEITGEMQLVADAEGELCAWRTEGPTDLEAAAALYFAPAPGGRGTEVRAVIDYLPPGGAAFPATGDLFGVAAEDLLRGGLRRLKQLLEAGEIATNAMRPVVEEG